MKVYDLSQRGTVAYYESQVEEAYKLYMGMLAYDCPEHQIRAVEDELKERIEMVSRIKKLHEHFAKKRNETAKKHK